MRLFRLLQANERLVADLPDFIEFSDSLIHSLGLKRDSFRTRISKDETVLIERNISANFRIDEELPQKSTGVHKVEILAQHINESEEKVIWNQLVYVQPTLKRTPEEIDIIAKRYAPVFLFSRKESYFPVSLSDLLRHPVLLESKGHVKVDTVLGEKEIPVKQLDEFLRFNGHQDYLLDQTMLDLNDSDFLKVHGDSKKSVVYYSYIEDAKTDRFFINYHTFYAFDPKTGIAKLLNIGPHIFDRESLTFAFDGSGRPTSLVLSGHLEKQAILFLQKLKMWNTGRVRIDLPDPDACQVGEHPIVPVAEGSHALYPTAGLYHISLLTELAGHVFHKILQIENKDDEPDEMETHQVLLPPSLKSDTFANYELRPLRLDLLKSEPLPEGDLYDPASACLVFSGYWVDVPGTHNERFPPFSRKEKDIEDWVDNAYSWQWKDLPKHIVEHNRALAEYIENRTKKA